MRINKMNAIVTGAASGLGLELTKQLLSEGANVAAVDINADNLKKLDADIIINNAGIIQPFVKVGDLEDNTINKVMNVNFFGPLNLIRYFMEDLTKDRKEQYIVNVASMGGFFPFPGQTIYGASKAALKIFTEGLYAELENSNVHVMIVLPGAMATNITKNSNVHMEASSDDSPLKLLAPDVAA